MKQLTISLFCLMAVLTLGACSDNDDVVSTLPNFTDITFEPSTVYAGEKITATAIQQRKGKLLSSATYTWTIEGDDAANASIKQNETRVVYDKNNTNPSCTFTAPAYGGSDYRIKLTAVYNISGQISPKAWKNEVGPYKVDYSISNTTGRVEMSRRLVVQHSRK